MRTTRVLLVPAVLVILCWCWMVYVTAETTSGPACVATLPTGGALSFNKRCNRAPEETTHCKSLPRGLGFLGNVYPDHQEVCQWACRRHKECCAPMGSCYVCCGTAKGICDNGRKGTVVRCMPNRPVLQEA